WLSRQRSLGRRAGKIQDFESKSRRGLRPNARTVTSKREICGSLFFLVTHIGFGLGLTLRRREAFQALEQLFLAHAVGDDLGIVGIDAGTGRTDERNAFGLGLVNL